MELRSASTLWLVVGVICLLLTGLMINSLGARGALFAVFSLLLPHHDKTEVEKSQDLLSLD
jgi:membrane associated rhomboid family serine protease